MTDVKPEDLRQISEAHDRLRAEIGKIVVGQDEVIEQMLECIFSRGHALVVGVPGLAKTLLISTIARALHLPRTFFWSIMHTIGHRALSGAGPWRLPKSVRLVLGRQPHSRA